MKLRTILFIVLFAFSIIPLSIYGYISISNNKNSVEEVVTNELESVSKMQILAIETFIESRRETLTILADFRYIKDAVTSSINYSLDDNTRDYINDMLLSRKSIKPFINSLSIIDKNYRIVGSSEEYTSLDAGKIDNVDHDYLKGDFRIGNLYVGRNNDNLIACYKGIIENNVLIGYVVEEIYAEYFETYTSTNLFEEEYVCIIDEKDQYIAKTKHISINEHLLDGHYKGNNNGSCQHIVDDEQFTTYYSKINYTNWYVIATTNLTSQINQMNNFGLLLMIMLLIIISVTIVSIFFVLSMITRPINSIIDTMNKVRNDDNYSVRINSDSKNEIGVIAKEIDSMLAYLEEVHLSEKEEIEHLKQEVAIDYETGAFNKHSIEGVINNVIECSDKAVIGFLDIDNFKVFNTKYGHIIGDEVIKYVATTIIKTIKGPVGRVGGDEFVFCFNNPTNTREIKQLMSELIKTLNEGFIVDNKKHLKINCSIGLVITSNKQLTYDDVVPKADKAMYMAKANGKNTFVVVEINE